MGEVHDRVGELVQQMKIATLSSAELNHFRHLAIKKVISSMRLGLENLEDNTENGLGNADKENIKIIKEYDLDHPFEHMPQAVAVACEALWGILKQKKYREND